MGALVRDFGLGMTGHINEPSDSTIGGAARGRSNLGIATRTSVDSTKHSHHRGQGCPLAVWLLTCRRVTKVPFVDSQSRIVTSWAPRRTNNDGPKRKDDDLKIIVGTSSQGFKPNGSSINLVAEAVRYCPIPRHKSLPNSLNVLDVDKIYQMTPAGHGLLIPSFPHLTLTPNMLS